MLDRRAAELPDAAADAERERIGKDVGRPVEEDDEQRPDRERDRERGCDPADRRAACAVRLDREEVRARACGSRDDQADDEREQEPAAADARLRHRPRARRDEQRHEHAERDQLAEGEVHDAGETEDERVADTDEPVDGPGSEPARKDLQGQRHHAAL